MIFRNILKTLNQKSRTKFYFGTLVNCSYPYQFGGIQSKSSNPQQFLFFQQLFGQDVTDGFKQAFVAILGALKDKDKNFLSQTMQKTLIQNIQFQDVELIDSKSPIQVGLTKTRLIMGGQFDRTSANRQVTQLMNDDNIGFELLFNRSGIKPGLMKIPTLFSCDVYFKGKIKLIKKNENKNLDRIQSHMLQFQIGNNMSMMQLMGLMKDMGNLQGKPDKANISKAFKIFIGKNYQWKIGDMDKVLKSNLFISKGNGLSGFF